MKQGIDVSEQVIKVYELYKDSKKYDKYIKLLDEIKTTEFWLNYSEEVKKFIEENNKVFFCEWDGYLGEIHSVESMQHDYKGTNLYDKEQFYGNQTDFGDYEDFQTLVKCSYVGEVVVEDNMTIVRLK